MCPLDLLDSDPWRVRVEDLPTVTHEDLALRGVCDDFLQKVHAESLIVRSALPICVENRHEDRRVDGTGNAPQP